MLINILIWRMISMKESEVRIMKGGILIPDLTNTMIPITRFNKGEAGKIFEEVKESGLKIVLKNNSAECILLSPKKYEQMVEMLSDYVLSMEAEQRMIHNDDKENLTHNEMMRELGISLKDLEEIDVEIE